MSEWSKDLPPPGRTGAPGKYDWETIVAELQSRPGEWRLVIEGANRGLPSAIKRKKMLALRDPGWDFQVATRNNNYEEGTADIWMSAVPAAAAEQE